MERKRKLLLAKGAVILAVIPILLWAHEYGPDAGYCGVPGELGTCAQAGCHVGSSKNPANGGTGNVTVQFPNGTTYTPGVKQHLVVTITDPVQKAWGFQLTARNANSTTTQAGSFTSTDANTGLQCASQVNVLNDLGNVISLGQSQVCPSGKPLAYMEHNLTGYQASLGHTGSFSYEFDWTPPSSNVGNVTIYVAANAAVGNLNVTSQDHIYTATYTITPAAPGFTCTNTATPTIASVDSASAYGGYSYFAPGSWLEIKGSNLADPNDPRLSAANSPGQWTSADFNGVNAPTKLDGVSVNINGKPAYVWYLSPGQLNVQAPQDTATGNVNITVTNCNATSQPFAFTEQALAPGLLAPSNYSANGTPYMVATFASDGAYVLNTSTGASFGLNSRPAKPGDTIIAYGVGFGDVTPSILPGTIVQQGNALVSPVTFSFGSTPAALSYSGLAGNFVGLYEFYITVPNVANGDYKVNVAQNGAALPQTMYITVHN